MITKTLNLLGIRKKAILARFNAFKGFDCIVLEGITKDQEIELNEHKNARSAFTTDDGAIISEDDIHMYGELDLNSESDRSLIYKRNIINNDTINETRSNFNYEKGTHDIHDHRVSDSPCNDPLEWFKYNYCLLGKPERIICYKINKACL